MTGPSVSDSERGPASGVSWQASPSLQVIAGGTGGTWFEILRTGALRHPLDPASDPSVSAGATGPTRDRSLDDLLSWLPADERRRVRSAMQLLRLGLQTWQGDVMLAEGLEPRGPGRLELTGGPWRAGLWAYVLRLSAVPEPERDDALDPAASIGRIAYADDLGTVTLDAAALALIAPPAYTAAGLSLHHWSQCFDGDDQMTAISALVWPLASPRPKGVTLRLATGSRVPVRRIELHVHRGGADGAVVALCRAHPEDLRASRPGA